LVGDAIFGIVEKQSSRFGGKPFATFAVLRKEFSQVQFLDFRAVRGEGVPGFALGQWWNGCCHVADSCFVTT
jgi:hypothetical protein